MLGGFGLRVAHSKSFQRTKEKKGFKIKFHHCSLNYKLRLVKENNVLIWKKRIPSPEHIVSLLMQLPLQTALPEQPHIRSSASIITLLKRLLLVIFLWSICPFQLSTTKSLSLFFLLILPPDSYHKGTAFSHWPFSQKRDASSVHSNRNKMKQEESISRSSKWTVNQFSASAEEASMGGSIWRSSCPSSAIWQDGFRLNQKKSHLENLQGRTLFGFLLLIMPMAYV